MVCFIHLPGWTLLFLFESLFQAFVPVLLSAVVLTWLTEDFVKVPSLRNYHSVRSSVYSAAVKAFCTLDSVLLLSSRVHDIFLSCFGASYLGASMCTRRCYHRKLFWWKQLQLVSDGEWRALRNIAHSLVCLRPFYWTFVIGQASDYYKLTYKKNVRLLQNYHENGSFDLRAVFFWVIQFSFGLRLKFLDCPNKFRE